MSHHVLTCAHLHRKRLEAHQTKVLYQPADGHVQRAITWRGGRQCVFEMGEVLYFGIKLQVEVCLSRMRKALVRCEQTQEGMGGYRDPRTA